MELGDKLHGFTVVRKQTLRELDATLYAFSYDKNGARLLWLDRADDNMTFAIAFRTPPQDDTGVFHIIEHSVLCGSEKYPVKDPFVILLKSSLQTFLNALTFSDKTAYPVCSRNRQDFLNLIDVYLDAVLHPLSAKDPHAFLQEGWHYELSEKGELTRNGVVYNEMKGSFANPDTVLYNALERSLFPDTCYGYVSGGDPEHIPELTYEGYLNSYHRCYHPSNSYIFLDGSIDPEAVLSKLDLFLCEFDAAVPDTEIPVQQPITPPQAVCRYEISAEEKDLDRVLLAQGYVYGTYDDVEEQYACEILGDVLTGTNDAPLCKALLERGLCEEVEIDNTCDVRQPFVCITLRNTSEEKAAECAKTVDEVLTGLVNSGLDHEQLHAALDHLEFVQREKDSGRTPIGLILGINALEEWLHGGDPVRKLELGDTFASLRRKIDEGWFEKLLARVFLHNSHRAGVMLLPDATLGQEKQERERTLLDALKNEWSASQTEAVRREFLHLREVQQTPDTPAQLATLPKLSLHDLAQELPCSEAADTKVGAHRLLFTEKATGGIRYLTLYFSLCDLTPTELSEAEFLCALLGELATEQYSPTALNTALQSKLGHFGCQVSAYAPNGKQSCDPYLEVSLAVLEEKKTEAIDLIREVLLHSRFDDTDSIFHLLRQERLAAEQAMISSGRVVALQHTFAALTAVGAASDATAGVGMLRWLQRMADHFSQNANAICDGFSVLCRRIFVQNRLTFALTGARDDAWLTAFAAVFPDGSIGAKTDFRPIDAIATGYQIPAQIGFAAKAADLGDNVSGAAKVASKILSLDYLWNEVRVKGGAYGVGFGVRLNGLSFFVTHRDPDPAGALSAFSGSGEALRRFCDSDESVDDYIISSVSDLIPLMSPRAEGQQNASLLLNGITGQRLQKQYAEVLHTTKDELHTFSRLLDEAQAKGIVCVVGGENTLNACGSLLTLREQLQPTSAEE